MSVFIRLDDTIIRSDDIAVVTKDGNKIVIYLKNNSSFPKTSITVSYDSVYMQDQNFRALSNDMDSYVLSYDKLRSSALEDKYDHRNNLSNIHESLCELKKEIGILKKHMRLTNKDKP